MKDIVSHTVDLIISLSKHLQNEDQFIQSETKLVLERSLVSYSIFIIFLKKHHLIN